MLSRLKDMSAGMHRYSHIVLTTSSVKTAANPLPESHKLGSLSCINLPECFTLWVWPSPLHLLASTKMALKEVEKL